MQVMNEKTVSKVLECILTYQKENGQSPSYRQIMRLCRLETIGKVQRCIRVLKERGEIEGGERGSIDMDWRLMPGRVQSVPLIGSVPCGKPVFAFENYESNYRLPEDLTGIGEHFMLRARGYSMINAGIKDGDLLFIRKQNYADFGEIVVALIEEETTVKRLEKKNGKIVLHPENPKFEDIYVPEDFAVLGIVDGFIRRF